MGREAETVERESMVRVVPSAGCWARVEHLEAAVKAVGVTGLAVTAVGGLVAAAWGGEATDVVVAVA